MVMIKFGQDVVRGVRVSCADGKTNVNPVIMLLIWNDYKYREERINGVLDVVKWELGKIV